MFFFTVQCVWGNTFWNEMTPTICVSLKNHCKATLQSQESLEWHFMCECSWFFVRYIFYLC